ncbi:putative E3 ubiquitin-protein ligase RHC2A [Silene latifolia]|uniref:putative E3 ubiquitin-protein ligase RHC2A n=1 Tax=Silene latifolia TaxID=37657 RepID=UPI003D784416
MSTTSSTPNTSSYWCYRCNRFVRVFNNNNLDSMICPDCNGGFVEQIDSPRRRFPSTTVSSAANPTISSSPRLRRSRRNGGDRSPFNPVIVLRAPSEDIAAVNAAVAGGGGGGYELYYDDGGGSGLRPLPPSVSEFLLGSGFDRLLDQLAQLEMNGIQRSEQPPASKAAIESMPTIKIVDNHVNLDSHCAVCKEAFELGVEAREMPCKHIYHSDCILPWLNLRNSCPVCRHELATDVSTSLASPARPNVVESGEDETVGLTIWRLPGGGFAVGRFSGGRRAGGSGGERELPVVYTEMDGGFNNQGGGVPRRISWGSRGGSHRESGGIRRALRNLFSCFNGGGGGVMGNLEDSTSSSSDSRSRSLSIFGSGSRRNRGFDLGGRVRRW